MHPKVAIAIEVDLTIFPRRIDEKPIVRTFPVRLE